MENRNLVDSEWLTNAVAHALRNPIFAALLQAEMLADRTGDSTAITVLDHLKRLQVLIEEMLLYGRPASVSPRKILLGPLLGSVVETYEFGDRGVSAVVQVELDDPGLELTTDPEALKIVLERLVDNAAQHTPAPHHVGVRAGSPESGWLEIAVNDDGDGISEEIRDEIFQPFRPQHKGRAGLGLAVAQKLAKALGGFLNLDQEAAAGSRFVVRLPYPAP